MKSRWQNIIWITGGVLIALEGLDFVVESITATKTHSWQEEAFLVIGVCIGALVVSIYGWKRWFNLRLALERGESLRSKIGWRWLYLPIIPVVPVLIYFMRSEMESAPEYAESRQFISANPAVLSRFGSIRKIELGYTGLSFQVNGDVRSGTYQFSISGSTSSGAVSIRWHDQNGSFIPTAIEDVSNSNNPLTLWSSNK